MNEQEIIAFILSTLMILGVNIGIIVDNYYSWIKKNSLLNIFTNWKETNKPFKWWISWSIVLSTSFIVHLLISLIGGSIRLIGIAFAVSLLIIFAVGIAYAVTKNFARHFHDKKESLCLPKESQEPKSAEEYFSISKINESPKDKK